MCGYSMVVEPLNHISRAERLEGFIEFFSTSRVEVHELGGLRPLVGDVAAPTTTDLYLLKPFTGLFKDNHLIIRVALCDIDRRKKACCSSSDDDYFPQFIFEIKIAAIH